MKRSDRYRTGRHSDVGVEWLTAFQHSKAGNQQLSHGGNDDLATVANGPSL
jgi:hypothetical protein